MRNGNLVHLLVALLVIAVIGWLLAQFVSGTLAAIFVLVLVALVVVALLTGRDVP